MQNPIFISYSRKDKEVVFPLVQQIESELDLKCWIDRDGVQSGDEFRDNIIQAIDSAEVVLFMLSNNSECSSFTKKEVDYAKNTGKRIIPIIVDGGKLRGWFLFEFGNIDYIDITNEDHLLKLLRDLKTLLKIDERDLHNKIDVNKNKVSLTVKDNKIVLDIIGKFSFVLEKDAINNVFIGNIPVREILDDVQSDKGLNGITANYLQNAFGLMALPFFPVLTGAYIAYKFLKKSIKQSKVESTAFDAIIMEINNRYHISLEKVTDDIRKSTDIALTEYAVSLDLSKIENSNKSLLEKLNSLC